MRNYPKTTTLAIEAAPVRRALTGRTVAQALHEAVRAIASQCDGAHSKDFVGFDGKDALFGARVAWHTKPEEWSPEMETEVYRMLAKYHGQLDNHGISYADLPKPAVLAEDTVHAARDEARAAERKGKRTVKVYLHDGLLRFKGKGTYDIKGDLKAAGARWDGANGSWDFEREDAAAVLFLVQSDLGIGVDESAEDLLAGTEPAKPKVTKIAKVITGKKVARIGIVWRKVEDEEFETLVREVRVLPDHQYLSSKKANVVGLTREALQFLYDHEFDGAESVEVALTEWEEVEKERMARESEALKASRADSTDREVALGEHLYEYQKAGVAYVLDHADGRAIIGDEMGLGKTRQAIAVLEDADAYPAVVVCPPHLTRNWLNEFKRVNPDRVVRIATGTSPSNKVVEGADVVIIGYSVLSAWTDAYVTPVDPWATDEEKNIVPRLLRPRGVVFDESHYAKNSQSQRTKAALSLTARVPDDGGVKLCLTGTVILNRLEEILPQIELIGRWSDFGSKAEVLRKYQWGNQEDFNTRLRSVCYVRRLKTEVLTDLPPKTRVEDEVDISDFWTAQYEKAERDVISWLAANRGEFAASRAAKAQALVKLNVLRQIAGQCKIDPAVNWINEFLESTERSLVVFASHIPVQDGIYDALVGQGVSVARIHSGDNDKKVDEEIARFQAGGARVIVCSLKKGGTGHTLTKASDVLMVEQDWTPATLTQAEDRVHRIGTTEAVTAVHLVAPVRIDYHLRNVIARKQRVFDAVAQGDIENVEQVQESVVDEVIGLLLKQDNEAAA